MLVLESQYTGSSVFSFRSLNAVAEKTRSHPEMVGDMSHVTLNFDLLKIPFVHF